jgi:hypothetical protein
MSHEEQIKALRRYGGKRKEDMTDAELKSAQARMAHARKRKPAMSPPNNPPNQGSAALPPQRCGYFRGKIPAGCRQLMADYAAAQELVADLRRQVTEEYSAHGRTVDELAFWKHQAIYHRAYATLLANGDRSPKPDEVDRAKAEHELELCRQQENRERYGHAEPPRDIGT